MKGAFGADRRRFAAEWDEAVVQFEAVSVGRGTLPFVSCVDAVVPFGGTGPGGRLREASCVYAAIRHYSMFIGDVAARSLVLLLAEKDEVFARVARPALDFMAEAAR